MGAQEGSAGTTNGLTNCLRFRLDGSPSGTTPNAMQAEDAYALLVRLGASARLVRHGELVAEAGDLLLAVMRSLEVEVDESLVRAGCLLHDVGKTLHPGELHGGGAEHEAAGERLLLAHDVDASIARCCRSHAQWRRDDV